MKKIFNRRKKNKPEARASIRKCDPLYIIFEKQLYDFNYDSREAFVTSVYEEYVQYLQKEKIVVPPTWKVHFEKSIQEEIADILVRKLYGCLNVEEFKQKEEHSDNIKTIQRETRKRYQKLVG